MDWYQWDKGREEALTRFADAIAGGLDAKLEEVVRAPALPEPTGE